MRACWESTYCAWFKLAITVWKMIAFGVFSAGPVTKLKNLSDVHSILLGAVENDFKLNIQKESYGIANDL